MRVIKSFFLALILTFPLYASGVTTDVLVITNDLGDMADLVQITKSLESENVDFRIAAIGTSAVKLDNHPKYVSLKDACRLHTVLDKTFSSEDKLDMRDVSIIRRNVKAKVCILPMSHRLLAEISLALDPKIHIIAYYDNLDSLTTAKFVQPFLKAPKRVDVYMFPSKQTLMESKAVKALEGVKTEVVGKPSLEEWQEIAKEFKGQKAKDVFKAIGIDPDNPPAILFAGGRDEAYRKYLPVFINGVKDVVAQVWLTYHPATDGSLERETIDSAGAKNIHLLIKNDEIGFDNPTAQLMGFAKCMACVQTSVDIKAAALGVPILYVNDPEYKPTLLALSDIATTPEEVKQKLDLILSSNKRVDLASSSIGIPSEAASKITTYILKILKG